MPTDTVEMVQQKHSALTLFDLEDELLALVNTETEVPAELVEQFAVELAARTDAAIAKRDRVGGFIQYCRGMSGMAKAEIERLSERKRWFERAGDKMEEYVVSVVESLGLDDKGKYRTLDGRHFTLATRACPASLDIKDGEAVPLKYKRVTVEMSAEDWSALVKVAGTAVPAGLNTTYSINNAALKSYLQRGSEVPGADLIVGKRNFMMR